MNLILYNSRAEKNRVDKGGYLSQIVDEIINALIRTRYVVSEEFAILRQKDTKPTEYASYNAFCESCKTLGKTIYAKQRLRKCKLV
jgi:hypothetical protein